MIRSEIEVKVTETIYQETGELVTPDCRLVNLVTDSLEKVSLIQALEDALGKEIPDEDAQTLFTVGDIVKYAEAH
jgi:acyl carrier protein